MNLLLVFVQYSALIISLMVHEFCHGFTAYLLGDETARRAERLTLNPLKHVELFGTVILPITAIITGLPIFGWAKPIPYNPYNLTDQKWGALKVALAGPLSNLAMALIFLTTLRLVFGPFALVSHNLLAIFLQYLAAINIVLGLFNLLPVPPLDGSKLIQSILRHPKYIPFLNFLELRGSNILMAILIVDIIGGIGLISGFFQGSINLAFELFGFGG